MNIFRHKLLKSSWTSPTFVLGRLIPGAYGVFVAGFVISAGIFSADRTLTLEDGIMSDLLSRIDNPHGYLISAIATMICGGLLLPAANLFQRGWKGSPRGWVVLGAWLYRLGLIAAIAVGVTTPLQKPYISAPIIGASKLDHFDQAIAALEIKLSDEEIKRLEELYQPHPILGHE